MVRLWEVGTWKERRRWQDSTVTSIAYAPDGRTLAAAGSEPVYLWDPTTGKLLHQLDMKTIWTNSVAFAPDSKLIALVRLDGRVELWDASSGQRVHFWNVDKAWAVAFSPDGKLLAASGRFDIHLWETATRRLLRAWESKNSQVTQLAFSPDGRLLVSGNKGGNGGVVKLWDYTTGQEVACLEAPQRHGVTALTFSPDGATLACRGGNAIGLYDVVARKEIGRLVGHYSVFLSALAFSPDGKLLASGSDDTTVIVWDVAGRLARKRTTTLSAEALEKRWADLASADVSVACRSQWELIAASEQSVGFVKDRLRPAPAANPTEETAISKRIADLDSDAFEVREKRMRELETFGDAALPALRKALKDSASAESRRRVQRLLNTIENAARQDLRGIEVLERIGTREARAVLESLVKGAPEAPRTREAKAAIGRLRN
jgi:dipeptidyl aminopeptidase/acylaminoacyl peptidase